MKYLKFKDIQKFYVLNILKFLKYFKIHTYIKLSVKDEITSRNFVEVTFSKCRVIYYYLRWLQYIFNFSAIFFVDAQILNDQSAISSSIRIYACQKCFRGQFTFAEYPWVSRDLEKGVTLSFALHIAKCTYYEGASCIFLAYRERGGLEHWLHGRLLILRVRFLRDHAPAWGFALFVSLIFTMHFINKRATTPWHARKPTCG